MSFAELERWTSRDLSRLPLPAAPATLLPRVMAAVQTWIDRPWYQRAWFTWPVAGQLMAAAACLALLVGVAFGLPLAQSWLGGALGPLSITSLTRVSGLLRQVGLVVTTVRAVWEVVVQPLAGAALVVIAVVAVACATLALALSRAVFGKAIPL